MTKIILATNSPYRKEAFGFLGLDFIAEDSKVDEYAEDRPNGPEELVKHLSKLKAEVVAKNHPKGIVIGFDSVGFFEGKILEKPKSKEEAFERLKKLSGNKFEFLTGIYMINTTTGKTNLRIVKTVVFMRGLTDKEINKYLEEDNKFTTCALGFDPCIHYSSTFVEKVEGSYNNLTRGIPLEAVIEMLSEIGYET